MRFSRSREMSRLTSNISAVVGVGLAAQSTGSGAVSQSSRLHILNDSGWCGGGGGVASQWSLLVLSWRWVSVSGDWSRVENGARGVGDVVGASSGSWGPDEGRSVVGGAVEVSTDDSGSLWSQEGDDEGDDGNHCFCEKGAASFDRDENGKM